MGKKSKSEKEAEETKADLEVLKKLREEIMHRLDLMKHASLGAPMTEPLVEPEVQELSQRKVNFSVDNENKDVLLDMLSQTINELETQRQANTGA